MTLNNNGQTGLSPIQELSDINLSFLISQLSSVSEEVTDRTIEELLRDAECQPPSLNWCRTQEHEKSESVKPDNAANENPNLFKTAIDNLSEITNRVQEKLTLDEEFNKNYEIDCNTFRTTSASYRPQSKIQSSKPATVLPKVDTRWTKNEEVSPKMKTCTRQSTINAAVKLYGKKLAQAKQPRTVQPIFVPSCNPKKSTIKNPKGKLSNVKNIESRTTAIIDIDTKSVRDLWEENARLNMQIQDIKEQLSLSTRNRDQNRVLPPLPPLSDCEKCNQLKNNEPDEIVARQLRQFETQLSAIQTTYQFQLDRLSQKCDELEKMHRKEVLKSLDVQVQTDLTEKQNVHVPDLNFDDLVLDKNFPMSAKAKVLPSCENFKKPASAGSNRNCNCFGEPRLLANTIRKLQTELDIVKKVNQRLKVQQSSLKVRSYAKNAIKRHTGTQTIGLGACSPEKYDPKLFEETHNEDREVEIVDLKKKIDALEKEVQILNEQKLKLLQEKHEEEMEILLDEKMMLSKKIDSLQSWNAW